MKKRKKRGKEGRRKGRGVGELCLCFYGIIFLKGTVECGAADCGLSEWQPG